MKWLICVALLAIVATPVLSQTSTRQSGRHSAKRKRTRTSAASYQSHPDAERYQEIQKALAERGYFKGEANGQWGEDSVDALRRFQTDQKIPNDGKIDSLSLIGLGLGPKHNDGSTDPAKPLITPSSPPASPVPNDKAHPPSESPP